MTEFRCPICRRMLINSVKICEVCSRETRAKLAQIPQMYVEAGAFLIPGKGGFGSSGSERTIGVNLAALGFRQAADLLGILTAWVEFIVEERDLAPANVRGTIEDRVTDSCAFLLRHSPWLAENELAADWCNEIALIHKEGLAATRQFLEKVTRIKCPTSLEIFITEDEIGYENCGAWLTLGENPLDPVECKRCQREWTTLRLVAVALSTPGNEILLEPIALAGYLEMELTYVHKFAKRHGIEKIGKKYSLNAFMKARATLSQRDTPTG